MHAPRPGLQTRPMSAVHDTLRHSFGFTSFRPHQEEIVQAIVSGRDVFAALPAPIALFGRIDGHREPAHRAHAGSGGQRTAERTSRGVSEQHTRRGEYLAGVARTLGRPRETPPRLAGAPRARGILEQTTRARHRVLRD